MYNGIINVDNLDANEILELLEACDELCFDELIKDSQNLISKLVYSKNENALKYISKLVNDFSNLLKESDYHDVEIKIGTDEQDDVKIFKAHSDILKTRCSYFKAALSNNWIKRSDNDIILFEKENISPKIFEVLLM